MLFKTITGIFTVCYYSVTLIPIVFTVVQTVKTTASNTYYTYNFVKKCYDNKMIQN